MTVTFSGLKQFYQAQHFYYSDEVLFNLYTSLKTKPFVILSGVSGSGKSKIIDLFAAYFSKELAYEGNYELVPVKPNWTDSRALFGYHNIIDNTYAITPVIKLFLRALQDPDKPYFLVLDEMNLAKVEHYFSDFLSLIESRKSVVTNSSSSSYIFKEEKLSEIADMSLPSLTIIAAIEMGLFSSYADIQTIRDSRLYKIWMENNPDKVNTKNWKITSRTEVNNKVKGQPDRFSAKFFVSEENNDELYRLRNNTEIEELLNTPKIGDENKKVLTIREVERFKSLINDYFDEVLFEETNTIVQEPIVLHQSETPLKVNETQTEYIVNTPLYDESSESYYVPNKIVIPLNVYVVGTVNIDETTYMFSPKVLDRSNVLEFNEIDLYGAYGYNPNGNEDNSGTDLTLAEDELNLSINLATSKETIWVSTNYPTEFKLLVDIFEILKSKNKHFGYRVFNEISLYLKNYVAHIPSDVDQAIDNQILQKVLPKLNGDVEELEDILLNLKAIIPATYSKSITKLDEMVNTLQSTGYVTFIK